MKKTLSVLALCLALLLVFTACSAPAQTTESAASEVSTNSEGRNVTFVLKNLVNPFCVTVKEGAEQAAKDLNVNLSVLRQQSLLVANMLIQTYRKLKSFVVYL